MIANIVVGMAFGDEGKGAAIASKCLAAKKNNHSQIVVRFNGGHQAGHSVYLDDKTHHYHSSFASGAILGLPTYISEHCTVYLPSLIEEALELKKTTGKIPKIYVHPRAMLTLPTDVITDKLHREKGTFRTVGVGHGRTKQRHSSMSLPHSRANLLLLKGGLKRCQDKFMGLLKAYKSVEVVSKVVDEELEFFKSWVDWPSYIEIADYEVLQNYHQVHFEGAQGTMLDMDYGEFPYVTHSNTTVKNAFEILQNLSVLNGSIQVKVYYCTRSYLTRHGDGPFSNTQQLKLINNQLEVNVKSEYQGDFRIAPLDVNILNYAFKVNEFEIPVAFRNMVRRNMIISCCDQLEGGFDDSTFEKIDFMHRLTDIHKRHSHISEPIY